MGFPHFLLRRRLRRFISGPMVELCLSTPAAIQSIFLRSLFANFTSVITMPSPKRSTADDNAKTGETAESAAASSPETNQALPNPAAVSADFKGIPSSKPANSVVVTTSKPPLRSRPISATAKVDSQLASTPVEPSTAVIDCDADWCDDSPLDHSTLMQDILAKIPSPPNEMEAVPTVGSDVVTPAVRAPMRDAPPRGLPVGSLRPIWLHCAKPVTTVTADHLQLEDVKTRVDVSVLRETERCGHGNDSASKWTKGALSRFTEVHKGYYFIPTSIKCDRTFFERPGDAIYIESMWLYLHNDSESLPPICTDARLYEVVVTADKAKIQQHQLMWAVLIVHGRVMTFEDIFVARRLMTDLSKAVVSGSEAGPLLCLPWEFFPIVPKWLLESVNLRSAHVTPIRALVFFAKIARDAGLEVYQRWNKSLQIELAIHVTVAHFTAWARPVIDQSRIWYPSKEHVQWLKQFAHLPPIPVYYEAFGKYMTVTILEDTLSRATPLMRKDYRTKTMVKFVATPNAQIYCRDPLREAVLVPTVTAPVVSGPLVAPVPPRATPKSNASSTLSAKGVMFGRVLKREVLRKYTRIPADIVTALKGTGPWTAIEVFDHLVANSSDILVVNQNLTKEAANLRADLQRLRDDVTRYCDDASRLGNDLRQLRKSQNVATYGMDRRYEDNGRGYGSRGYYDPYERRY